MCPFDVLFLDRRWRRRVRSSAKSDRFLNLEDSGCDADDVDNDYQSDMMRKRMSVYRYASFTGANPIVAREASKGGGPV